MKRLQYLVIAVILIAALVVAGCAETEDPVPPVATPTPTPEPPPEEPDIGWSLTPGPIGEMPVGKAIAVTVSRDPLRTDINVVYNGGHGHAFIRHIEATLYAADGRVETQTIERPLTVGKSLTFTGTEETDRMKVTAHYTTGEVVVISDATYRYRARA